MAAIQPDYVPHLDEKMQQTQLVDAEVMPSIDGTQKTLQLAADPPGEIRTLNEKILNKARNNYKKMVYGVMFPYGYDFVLNKNVRKGYAGSGLKKKLWKKAQLRAMIRKHNMDIFQGKPAEKLPKNIASLLATKRPRLKEIAGHGSEPTIYSTVGMGSGKMKAHGGAIGAALASIAVPLAMKALKALGKLTYRKIKERLDRRHPNRKKLPKELRELAEELMGVEPEVEAPVTEEAAPEARKVPTPTPALPKALNPILQPGAAKQLEREPNPKTMGSGKTPTTYQMEQATKVADAASKEGRVGMPNPLAFPEYPPGEVPNDGISMMRHMYNTIREGLHGVATTGGIPSHKALKVINKYIRRHARAAFGKGGADAILSSSVKGPALRKGSLYEILAPILERNLNTGHEVAALHDILKTKAMHKTIKGNGVSDVLHNLSSFLSGPGEASKSSGSPIDVMKSAARFLVGKAKSYFPTSDGGLIKGLLKNAVQKLAMGAIPDIEQRFREKKKQYEGYVPRPKRYHSHTSSEEEEEEAEETERRDWARTHPTGHGKLVYHGGSMVLDLLKTAGKYAVQYGAPLAASLASNLLGDKYGGITSTVSKIATKASEAAEESIERDQEKAVEAEEKKQKEELIDKLEAARKEAKKDLEEERDKTLKDLAADREKAIKEYKDARKLTSEDFSTVMKESEAARRMAELLKGTSLSGSSKGLSKLLKGSKTGGYPPLEEYEDRLGKKVKRSLKGDDGILARYDAMIKDASKSKGKHGNLSRLEEKVEKAKLRKKLKGLTEEPEMDEESKMEKKLRLANLEKRYKKATTLDEEKELEKALRKLKLSKAYTREAYPPPPRPERLEEEELEGLKRKIKKQGLISTLEEAEPRARERKKKKKYESKEEKRARKLKKYKHLAKLGQASQSLKELEPMLYGEKFERKAAKKRAKAAKKYPQEAHAPEVPATSGSSEQPTITITAEEFTPSEEEGEGIHKRRPKKTNEAHKRMSAALAKASRKRSEYVLKPLSNITYGMGPTTADAVRDRRRASSVMTLSKKIKVET